MEESLREEIRPAANLSDRAAARTTDADPGARRRLNLLIALDHRRYRDMVVTSGPVTISLACSPGCNLRCVMCERRTRPGGPGQAGPGISHDLLASLAEQTFSRATYLRLNTSGEPLLSSTLDLELELAERYGMRLLLISNGQTGNEALWQRLIALSARIDISVDSPTRETYEKIREGGSYDTLITNLRNMSRLARLLPPTQRPELNLGMILMRETIQQLPLMIILCASVGFDRVRCSLMTVFSEETSSMRIEPAPNFLPVVSQSRELAGSLGIGLELPGWRTPPGKLDPRDEPFDSSRIDRLREDLKTAGVDMTSIPDRAPPAQADRRLIPVREDHILPVRRGDDGRALDCPFLWQEAFLDAEGRIMPCCAPDHPVIGDLRTQSFDAIYNGEPIARMRGNFNPRSPWYGVHPICGSCARSGFLRDNF